MRRSDFIAGAAVVGGLVAPRSAEAGVIGSRRALLSGKQLGVNLINNPTFANGAASWSILGTLTVNSTAGPGGTPAMQYAGSGSTAPATSITQYLTLVPNGVYSYSGWVSTAAGGTGGVPFLGVLPTPFTFYWLSYGVPGTPVTFAGTFVAQGSTAYVQWNPTGSVCPNGSFDYFSAPSVIRIA